MEQCYKTGCVGQKSFQHCQFLSNAKPIDGPWYLQEPLYLHWKQWDCHSDCPCNCLVARKKDRNLVISLSCIMGMGISTCLWNSEKLEYSSAVFTCTTLILVILQAFNVRIEAARIMVAAPLIASLATHIMYLNVYDLDYGLNIKVCGARGLTQLLIWAVWAGVTHHASGASCGWWLWVEVSLCSWIPYDFPPYHGFVDAHGLWLWSFVRDDAEFSTSSLLKKIK